MRIELTSHATTHDESSPNHAEKAGDPFSALLASHAPPSEQSAPKTLKSAEERAAQSEGDAFPSIPPVLSMPVPQATALASASAVTMPVPRDATKSTDDATTISAGKKRKKDESTDDADATKTAMTAPLPPPMKPLPDVMSLTLALKMNVNDASASTDDSASNGDAPTNGSPNAPQNPLLFATQPAPQNAANANRDLSDARANSAANANARASADAPGRANMATYASAVNSANAISIRDADAKKNAGANADASEGAGDEDGGVDANRLFALTRDTLRSTAMDQPTPPAPPPGASAFPPSSFTLFARLSFLRPMIAISIRPTTRPNLHQR